MSRNEITLYIWLAIIILAGVIICVLILKKQKRDREKQEAARSARKPEPAEVRSASAQPVKPEPAKAAPAADMIDLNTVLDKEDLRLLSTDLSCLADKLQAQGIGSDEIKTVRTVSGLVSGTGIIPKQALKLCVLASQDMVDGVASTFGLSMGGHNAMLEKLKKLQEENL